MSISDKSNSNMVDSDTDVDDVDDEEVHVPEVCLIFIVV
jgi:hypothetical protein